MTASFHVHNALAADATRQEIVETIGVAVLMGGSPSVRYGAEYLEALTALEALVKFEKQEKR